MGDQPAMQIVGDLNVTNISKYGVFVMGAKLRKPKAVGHALVRTHDSNMHSQKHIIPQGGVSDLRFDFFVQPLVCEKGKPFNADVAIVDQFGNEHWLKGLEFPDTCCPCHLTHHSSRPSIPAVEFVRPFGQRDEFIRESQTMAGIYISSTYSNLHTYIPRMSVPVSLCRLLP